MPFRALALLVPLLAATPALAHGGHVEGLATGFAHPLLGLDHLLAMLAMGVWAARSGLARPALLPVAFLAGMAGGIAAGLAGWLPDGLEHAVAGTLLALGLALVLAVRLPAAPALATAALFGLLHGGAHGGEIGGAPLATAAGMLAGAALLQAAGFGLGRVAFGQVGLLRAGGAGVAAAGLVLLVG
jgi:urease accessory protein